MTQIFPVFAATYRYFIRLIQNNLPIRSFSALFFTFDFSDPKGASEFDFVDQKGANDFDFVDPKSAVEFDYNQIEED